MQTNAITTLLLLSPLLVNQTYSQRGWFPEPETKKKEQTVYWTDAPPTIDGDLSDELWKKLPRVTGFVDITFKHAYVPDQTLITIAYDNENLYLAIDARDRFAETIKGSETKRDEHLWSAGDDVLEIYFDPDMTGDRLIQIAFNPIGTQWDYRKDNSEGVTMTGWDGNWRVGTRKNDNGWSAEVVFPFADLPWDVPKPGDRLRANIARTSRNRRAEVNSTWSIITHAFANFGQYGFWKFATPGLEVSREDEFEINREFFDSETPAMKSLAQRGNLEGAMAKGLRAEADSKLSQAARQADGLSAELLRQSSSILELDDLLKARLTGHALNTRLKTLSTEISLIGIAGPLDGLAESYQGILRAGRHWVLAGKRGVYAVSADSGAVAGVWDRKIGSRVIAASYDRYQWETMDDKVFGDERFDRVKKATQPPDSLTLECFNPLIPGLVIRKEYRLLEEGRMLSKRIHVSQSTTGRTLLGVTSDTVFDPAFRASSRYNRVMPSGSAGGSDERPTIDAGEITKDFIQRGGSNKACGWAQFVMANKKTNTGIGQYLYKVDGQYVWTPYAMPSSYWNERGWQISFLGTFLDEEPFSCEMRYHLFDGDQVDFYREYLALPEVVAERNILPISGRMAGMLGGSFGESVSGAQHPDFPANKPRASAAHDLLRSDEVNLVWGIPRHNLSGDYPVTDDAELIWINERNAKLIERASAGGAHRDAKIVSEQFPRNLLSSYSVHTSLNKDSEAYRHNPNFALQNKDGSLAPSTHFGTREVDNDMSPAWVEYAVNRYRELMEYYSMGWLYFDFFGGFSGPDWHDGRVVQSTDYMHFDREIRKAVAERDAILFANGFPGQLYIDITFIEAIARDKSMFEKEQDWWRWHHERMMYYKLFERENMVCMPLIWVNYKAGDRKTDDYGYDDNNRQFTNLILALGFRAHTCYYEYDQELRRDDGTVDMERIYNYEIPYHRAAMEMHNTRLANAGLQPRYWTSKDSLEECYVLRKGPACFFTSLNHHPEPKDITSSAEIEKLGFKPGRRLFRFDYTRRNDDEIPRLIGPETPGWDRLFTETRCTTRVVGDEPRLHVTFPNAAVDYTCVATFTQVPGVLVSKEGIECQFRLPQTLRCQIDGHADEESRRVSLTVNAVTEITAAAWWPDVWGDPAIVVDGLVLNEMELVHYGEERFVQFALPKGKSKVTVRKKARALSCVLE
jgi:hypothetical protein